MAVSNRGLRLGLDLSNPVRAVLFSEESGEIAAFMTAQTGFDQGSKVKLTSLAREIRDFCRPFKVRPDGVASLPIENCHLFTVSIPLLDKKEFRQAIHLQVERVVPGGSNKMCIRDRYKVVIWIYDKKGSEVYSTQTTVWLQP